MIKINRKKKEFRAFTLIELIISMTILVIGTVGVLSLTVFAIDLNKQNMNRIQAMELAREGVEAIRNIRDSNWKNNYPFNEGNTLWGETISGRKTVKVSPIFSDSSAPWEVESVNVDNRDSYQLYTKLFGENTLFTHDISGTVSPSAFYRLIELTPLNDNLDEVSGSTDKIKAVSRVIWLRNGQERSVEMVHIFTDWKKI